MRFVPLCLLLPVIAASQTPHAGALVRGVLLERDTQLTGGQFSIRAADNQVLRYLFDRKTYVERESQLIDVPRLAPGEKIEVVSDIVSGSPLRYARTIHVMQDAPPPRPSRQLTAGRPRPYRPGDEPRLPVGSLTYSGVVFRLGQGRMAIHTRDGDQILNLRQDTRYLQAGEMVDLAALKPNTRVFVRAGKDVYDQLEAYQIVWGNILNPQ